MTHSQRTSLIEWITVLGALTLFGLTITSFVPSSTIQRGVSIASIEEIAQVGDGQFPWNAQLSSGPAPDFEMLGRNGEVIRLSDYRGRVVFLNFWATNCEPCRKEIPDLGKLADKMSGLPFVILAVTTDTDWKVVDEMFPTKNADIQIGLDPRENELIKSRYGTDKIPESYIISKSGELKMRFVNVHPWNDDRMQRYLEVLTKE